MFKRVENNKFTIRRYLLSAFYVYLFIHILLNMATANEPIFTKKEEVTFSNLSTLSLSQQKTIKQWINSGINASQTTLGLPYQEGYHFDLMPRYFASEPVPWARVIRGDIDSIELHFFRYASFAQLKKDWTLYHELSHLYHPLFEYSDFWLAEGLATYLQQLIMFQNRVINRDEFYQRISAGLSRGKRNTKEQIGRLNSVSENMWQLDAFQRVYWSGVAYFIEVENALKKQNKPNLLSLIKRYQVCCRQSHKNTETGINFVKDLDRLSRSAIFSSHYFRYRNRTDFPAISSAQIRQLIQPKTLEK